MLIVHTFWVVLEEKRREIIKKWIGSGRIENVNIKI